VAALSEGMGQYSAAPVAHLQAYGLLSGIPLQQSESHSLCRSVLLNCFGYGALPAGRLAEPLTLRAVTA